MNTETRFDLTTAGEKAANVIIPREQFDKLAKLAKDAHLASCSDIFYDTAAFPDEDGNYEEDINTLCASVQGVHRIFTEIGKAQL